MSHLLLITVLATGVGLLAVASQRHLVGSLRLPKRDARPSLCPHLGLASDPLNHYPSVSEHHRCYMNMGRERIDLGHQRRYCLGSCYSRCPFLTVEQKGLLERLWAWVRAVSPVPQVPAGGPRRSGGSPWVSPLVAKLRVAWRQMARKVVPFLRELNPLMISLVLWLVERGAPRAWASVRRVVTNRRRPSQRPRPATPPVPPEAAASTSLGAPPALMAAVSQDDDLIEAGIRAIEEGDEPGAYHLFKQATQMGAGDPRAWFWRAKSAETLDEVISCLERALALEPNSSQIKTNLDWAVQRRQQADASRVPKKEASAAETAARAFAPRSPRARERLRGFGLEITRCLTAVAAFGIGAAWLLSAVPPELRQSIAAAADLRVLQVPDATLVFAQFPLPVLAGGYPTASALPYGFGFLAEFVGLGLLSGRAWTRAWAPVVGLASAWLWFHAGPQLPSELVLLGCAVVASGGVLVFESESRLRPANA